MEPTSLQSILLQTLHGYLQLSFLCQVVSSPPPAMMIPTARTTTIAWCHRSADVSSSSDYSGTLTSVTVGG